MYVTRKGSDEEKRARVKRIVLCPTCGTYVNWFRRMAHIHARMWLEDIVYAQPYEHESHPSSGSDRDEGPQELDGKLSFGEGNEDIPGEGFSVRKVLPDGL
jgi:hypothetical protein